MFGPSPLPGGGRTLVSDTAAERAKPRGLRWPRVVLSSLSTACLGHDLREFSSIGRKNAFARSAVGNHEEEATPRCGDYQPTLPGQDVGGRLGMPKRGLLMSGAMRHSEGAAPSGEVRFRREGDHAMRRSRDAGHGSPPCPSSTAERIPTSVSFEWHSTDPPRIQWAMIWKLTGRSRCHSRGPGADPCHGRSIWPD